MDCVLWLCLMCSEIKVLILGVCGVIRSLSRVLLGFVLGIGVRKIFDRCVV